jgi:4-diphosphocytidyl-2-C-methyl-D-erythritol kinase
MIAGELANTPAQIALFRQSPAKLNLSLRVIRRRDDGFHEIDTLAIGVGLCDDLVFRAVSGSGLSGSGLSGSGLSGPGLSLTSDCADLPLDDGNLILRAARLLRERMWVAAETNAPSGRDCRVGGLDWRVGGLDWRVGGLDWGVCIELRKRIPLGSGLGGGSGNAACALRALHWIWGGGGLLGGEEVEGGLSEEALISLGAELGSDVPLFFHLPAARARGRGEKVSRVAMHWSGYVVLVFADRPVSTVEAYRRCEPDAGSEDLTDALVAATSAWELGSLCRNGLREAVFGLSPEVDALRRSVLEAGASHAGLSGAGRTIFVLFDDIDEADAFRLRLASRGINNVCVAPAPFAAEP